VVVCCQLDTETVQVCIESGSTFARHEARRYPGERSRGVRSSDEEALMLSRAGKLRGWPWDVYVGEFEHETRSSPVDDERVSSPPHISAAVTYVSIWGINLFLGDNLTRLFWTCGLLTNVVDWADGYSTNGRRRLARAQWPGRSTLTTVPLVVRCWVRAESLPVEETNNSSRSARLRMAATKFTRFWRSF